MEGIGYISQCPQKNRTYTTIAKVPYLRAIEFYRKNDTWNGGGIFIKNDAYWLNDGKVSNHILEKKVNLIVEKNDELNVTSDGEDAGICFYKLVRDGWGKTSEITEKHSYKAYFHKKITKYIVLCKIFYATVNHPIGRGCYYETYEIVDIKNKTKWEFRDWEWTDFDKNRLIWAEYGKIMQGNADENGIKNIKELFDTNPLSFEEIKAPYE